MSEENKEDNDKLSTLPSYGTIHELSWKGKGEWFTYKVLLNEKQFMQHIQQSGLEWML